MSTNMDTFDTISFMTDLSTPYVTTQLHPTACWSYQPVRDIVEKFSIKGKFAVYKENGEHYTVSHEQAWRFRDITGVVSRVYLSRKFSWSSRRT